MKLLLPALLIVAVAIVPATLTLDTADACQPYSWICPLNGQWYQICGTNIPPPIVKCAEDTLRDASIPALP